MKKKALITGINGQDGAYLAEFLVNKGYEVFGTYRRTSGLKYWRLEELCILDQVSMVSMDLLEMTNILRTMDKIRPDEVYNLAAQSFVGLSFEQPILTSEIDAIGPLRILEALRQVKPGAKFYQASTSEMFGKITEQIQSESTAFYPRSPYGVSKLFAHWMTINYRESYDMFAATGILFNHESPLRGEEFVTRKISMGVARIKQGLQEKLVLGNLDAKRDWGYAPDYVKAMHLILQNDSPKDYVIATGENFSVREFVEYSFQAIDVDIDWQGEGVDEKGLDRSSGRTLVEVSPEYYRPAEVEVLLGDSTKARTELGWKPKTSFQDLVRLMVEKDLERIKKAVA